MLYNVSMAISLFTVLTQCRTVLLCCHLAVAPRRRAWRHRFHHRGMGRVQGCTCTQLLYYRVHKLSHYIFIYVIYIYILYILFFRNIHTCLHGYDCQPLFFPPQLTTIALLSIPIHEDIQTPLQKHCFSYKC